MATTVIRLIKAALEDAKFQNPETREHLVRCLNNIEADLEEVGYEPGQLTKDRFAELETYLSSLEDEEAERLSQHKVERVKPPTSLDDEEDGGL